MLINHCCPFVCYQGRASESKQPGTLLGEAGTDAFFLEAGLAENRCLERRSKGAKLLQVGEQEIAFGAKFRARVVLDIEARTLHPAAGDCYQALMLQE